MDRLTAHEGGSERRESILLYPYDTALRLNKTTKLYYCGSLVQSNEFDRTVDAIMSSRRQAQLVVAAAGSGKTKLLVDVLTKRIAQGLTDPEKQNVIVFTFTNNAADELVVRLSMALEPLGKDIMSKIFVGTIHGWCNDYLTDTGVLANTKVVDELEQAQTVQRVFALLHLGQLYAGKNQFVKIDQFLADLELFYNEGLDIQDRKVPTNVRSAVENYSTFMRSQRLLDFGSLIREAISRLQENGMDRQFDIYIDEYQDVNPAQVQLLRSMLSAEGSMMLAVADPRQAIYQWRGSDVERTLAFSSDFKDSQIHEITINHRSRTGIVGYANLTAREMDFAESAGIQDMQVSVSRQDKGISVVLDENTMPNESGVADLIERLLKQGTRPGDIAVLMRSVLHHGQPIMDALDHAGVPYYSPNRNAGTAFVNGFILSIIDLISIIHEKPNPPSQIEEQELRERIANDLDGIAKYSREKNKVKIHSEIGKWYKELTKDGKTPQNERYNFRKQFFDFCKVVGMELDPSDSTTQEGFSAVTQIMRAIEEAYRRRFLSGYHIRDGPVEVFTHNLSWQLEHELERWTEIGMTPTRTDAVTISTVHAAKGLEWPVVIIPYAWEGRFPTRSSSHGTSFSDRVAKRYGTTVEDERRLWYVAITRPRDRLYVFCGDGKRTISQFVHPEAFGRGIVGLSASSTARKSELSVVDTYAEPNYLHLGVSDMLLLLECPYHFFLRRVIGVDVPVGEQLGAGNIAHRVIQRVVEEGTSDIDDIVREEVYLPLSEVQRELKTKQSVKSRVKRLVSTGILDNVDRTEYRFSFRQDQMVVSGIVDATIKSAKNLTLVDWKFTVHKEYKHRYERQLQTYAFGLRSVGTTVADAILYDLSQKGRLAEVSIDVGEKIARAVVEGASTAYIQLSKGPFTTPGKVACAACDVSQVCPDSLAVGKHVIDQ